MCRKDKPYTTSFESKEVKCCLKKILSKRTFTDYLAQVFKHDSMNKLLGLYLSCSASNTTFDLTPVLQNMKDQQNDNILQ